MLFRSGMGWNGGVKVCASVSSGSQGYMRQILRQLGEGRRRQLQRAEGMSGGRVIRGCGEEKGREEQTKQTGGVTHIERERSILLTAAREQWLDIGSHS